MTPNRSTIILFTESFPYGRTSENAFLAAESAHLASISHRLIVVPRHISGPLSAVPAKIKVETSLAQSLEKMVGPLSLIRAVLSPLFYRELFARPSLVFSFRGIRRLLAFVKVAQSTKDWLLGYLKNKDIDLARTVFYTYWMNDITMGIGLVKDMSSGLKLISRAHGYDLYEDRYLPAYIPGQGSILKRLDRLFLISENGLKYIKSKFSCFASRCELSRLGVNDPGFTAGRSMDGVFRIVTCSYLRAVKRLDLLLRGLACLGTQRPKQRFEWHHLGDGPLLPDLKEMAGQILPKNVKVFFHGQLSNEAVIDFYRTNPVDLFMNVSSFEGGPVSIMEAQSCGIPVGATAVGGTPELVSNLNGFLFARSPQPEELAQGLLSVIEDQQELTNKREISRNSWNNKVNAQVNHRKFAQRLKDIINQDHA